MRIRCIYKIKFLRYLHIEAITLYPFIIFQMAKEDVSEKLFRHELEHIYQVERKGFLRFYISYLRFYFRLRFQGLDHHQAYLQIPYEVEARATESFKLSRADTSRLGLPDFKKI